MKHLKLFFALFAMLALGVGNAWGAALGSGYEKVTNISNLTTGDRVVVYADDISKGVTGWDGSKDATVAESGWVEYLVEVASGGVTLKDEGQSKYISLTTKNTFTYADNGSVCKVNTTGVLAITLNSTDYFLYQNGTNYRMYTDKSSYSNYYPFYVYKVVAGGAETEDLGDALKWSAATATVQVGADDNEYPTLVNDKNVTVTYSSASTDVATINETTGVVTLVKEGTTTISAFYEGGEIDGVTYSAKNVSYTLTVKPAPLVIEPIEGGIIDILTYETFGVTSTSYTSFSGKQATNDNHSDAVYAGKTARNGNATQYNIQLNQLKDGRQFATTTSGGLARRVYVKWATQTDNTNARELYIYGSNTAFTGTETTAPSTKIGTIQYTTGAAEAYADLTGDYKFILITGSAAIYMDEIQVTWVSAAGTVVTPTISGETEFVESTEVSISTEPGYKVYYTLNGEDPTNTSEEYTAPFTVNATTIVKAIAYDGTSASDVVSATFKKLQSLTCAEAAELCTTTESADKYVIRGYVTSIPYPYSASNTAPTFWMADTKGGDNVMQAYRVTPVEETDQTVAVGDQVQVIGKIKLYNSTPEVNTGIYTITIKNPEYNVNITSAHGTVTATPAPAVEGAEVTLSVEVESGWVFQSWTVTDASSNPIEVVDNKFTMPASDVTVVANYTESEAPDAVLKLSANGTIISTATYKVGEAVELPATIENDCVKMFVGWSADANCATAPEYAPGADFELTAAEHTLYAVYANGTTGETVTIEHNSTTTTNMTGNNDANTFFSLDAAAWSIVSDKGGGSNHVGLNKDGSVRLYYNEEGNTTLTITAPSNVASVQFACVSGYADVKVNVNGTAIDPVDGVYTIDAETFVVTNASTTQVRINSIAVTLAGALDNFSTTCTAALAEPTFSLTEGEYNEAKTVTISATEGEIYYTLDGNTPTKESTPYTEAIVLDKCGEYTIKAIAINSESESPVASATYTISLPIPANDADNPYTGEQAIEVYNSGCYDGETLVYVTGTVQTAEYSSEYGNYEITFADGFQCFRLQMTATEKFTEDIIGAGDVIVAYGKLDKYGSNYQLAAGCYLVEHTPSVKADAELAWNPETVTLTVGDAFTAPTLSNPHTVSGITYESSNEAVATVSAEGVIALVNDAVGTATITAKFGGDATYKLATATCTIQVNPAQEDCEGSDDFETATATNASSYNNRTTEAGWQATNAAKTTLEGYTYLTINGKTSAVGTITSPVLNGGIGSIKIRYANTYSESNGVSFQLDIKQNDAVVKTYTITKANDAVVEDIVYTELIEDINVAGDFQMVFTNLSPTNSTSNKDRVSIGRLCWTGYTETPQEPEEIEITLNDMIKIPNTRLGRYSHLSLEDYDGNQLSIYNGAEDAYGEFEVNGYLAEYDVTASGTGTWALVDGVETLTATLQVEGDNSTIYIVTATVAAATTESITCTDAHYYKTEYNETVFTGIVNEMSTLKLTVPNLTTGVNTATDFPFMCEYGPMFDPQIFTATSITVTVTELTTYTVEGEFNDEVGNTYNITITATPMPTENMTITNASYEKDAEGNIEIVGVWNNTTVTFTLPAWAGENGEYAETYLTTGTGDGDDDFSATAGYAVLEEVDNKFTLTGKFMHDWEAKMYNVSVSGSLTAEEPTPDYTRTVTAGNYGTICLPNGSSNYTGATFFEIAYRDANGVYLDEVKTLVAGVPYIFQATSTEIAVIYEGEAAAAGSANGLYGTFTEISDVAAVHADKDEYILTNGVIRLCEVNCTVPANRAYIVLEEVSTEQKPVQEGRRRISMTVQGENEATGLDNITTTDAPVKVLVNGQLIIIREGVKYNVQGVRL